MSFGALLQQMTSIAMRESISGANTIGVTVFHYNHLINFTHYIRIVLTLKVYGPSGLQKGMPAHRVHTSGEVTLMRVVLIIITITILFTYMPVL